MPDPLTGVVLPRLAADYLRRASRVSPVVVVMGARQTGKSTLVQTLPDLASRPYITLDDLAVLEQARTAPDDLVRRAPTLTIDEVQREADLVLAIKRAVDEQRPRAPGRFILTGSANLLLMRRVSETLAGRATYVNLWPLTRREQLGRGQAGRWDDLFRTRAAEWPSLLEAGDAPPADWRVLARAVLLDAERLRLTARGGWRGIFRAVKAARLMHVVTRMGRSYQVELTGPAAPYIVRPARYGARLARVIPALARAPAWRLEADVRRGEESVRFRARGRPRAAATSQAPIGAVARHAGYDSAWERSLAADFRHRFGAERGGWHLSRETTPVAVGDELFLPDFTLRHADGREALIELVGFWTPEYLEAKARKIAAARLDHLILVVYRGLAVGSALDALTSAVDPDHVVWFAARPRAAEVMRAAERLARH